MEIGNCIWSVELVGMGFQGAWSYGSFQNREIGWKLKMCRRWFVRSSCRFVTTITSTFIAFGIREPSVFVATLGRRFCITNWAGEHGIGFPNALLYRKDGAVVSDGSHLCLNCTHLPDLFPLWFRFRLLCSIPNFVLALVSLSCVWKNASKELLYVSWICPFSNPLFKSLYILNGLVLCLFWWFHLMVIAVWLPEIFWLGSWEFNLWYSESKGQSHVCSLVHNQWTTNQKVSLAFIIYPFIHCKNVVNVKRVGSIQFNSICHQCNNGQNEPYYLSLKRQQPAIGFCLYA